MMIPRLFVRLACAGTLAAQTFIQMTDYEFLADGATFTNTL